MGRKDRIHYDYRQGGRLEERTTGDLRGKLIMSEKTELADAEKLAAARGVDIDPLLGEGEVFEETGGDPFEFYKKKDMDPSLSQGTLYNHETAFRDWKGYMEDKDRHYACPNEDNVRSFIKHLRELSFARWPRLLSE